jgi:hypothetical protein
VLVAILIAGCDPARDSAVVARPTASAVQASASTSITPQPAPASTMRLAQAGTQPSWNIESTPAGAAIWIDGADTGAKTPARFEVPPPGKHEIRLVMSGYADDVSDLTQVEDHGLSFVRILRKKVDVDREQASLVASRKVVDEAAREATRKFFGSDLSRAEIKLDRGGSIGLPPATLQLRGDGTGTVSWAKDVSQTQSHPIKIAPGEARRLFDVVIAQGFAEMVCAERLGIPDEVRHRITITSATGSSRACEKWDGDAHARFDAVLAAARRVIALLPPAVRSEAQL